MRILEVLGSVYAYRATAGPDKCEKIFVMSHSHDIFNSETLWGRGSDWWNER